MPKGRLPFSPTGYPVDPIAFNLAWLGDVDVSSSPPADGDTLVWVDADKKWKPGAKCSEALTVTTQTSSYALALTDQATIVLGNDASAQTITVPTNASVAFPVGTVVTVIQEGAGQVTIAAAGGVTLNAANGKKAAHQWSVVNLLKIATDTWVVTGDTTT